MSDNQMFLIMNGIARVTVFICVTIAAICFKQPAILWFYVVPVLMSPSTKD